VVDAAEEGGKYDAGDKHLVPIKESSV